MPQVVETVRPNATVWGYALFQATNAAGLWGGVFPFLPAGFQTHDVLLVFFLAQAFAFTLSYLASVLGVYFFPSPTRRFLVPTAAAPYFVGWCLLIAGIYLPEAAVPLAMVGGAALGVGSAGFYMLWQRLFAGQEAERGTRDLILGTAYGSLIYFALYLIPVAVTTLLIPTVFMPLFGLSIVLASRQVDLDQPMFNERPRSNPAVYRNVLRDFWRGALAIGILGLSSGVMRSTTIGDTATGSLMNMVSMTVILAVSLALLFVWQHKGVRISLTNAFRLFYPFVVAGFFVLPFGGEALHHLFAGAVYAAFACATMLLMAACAQASRDGGINPVFVYGFAGVIVYALHDAGFMAGAFVEGFDVIGIGTPALVSLTSLFLLALVYFIMSGGFHQVAPSASADEIELVVRVPKHVVENVAKAEGRRGGREFTDRLSKQCALVQEAFGLTSREAQVMERIARGHTVDRIAEELVISPNTVRTHSRRIYAKLDVHKKQELIELVEGFSPKGLS